MTRRTREEQVTRGLADRAVNEIARSIGRASVHYASELCRLSCAPLLMPLFPNFKEVTESFAAFHAVRNHLPDFSPKDNDVTVICVGDGSTARTGATFALRTAWNVISIDPAITRKHTRQIRRLDVIAKRIEETRTTAKRALVVAVHSHADLTEAVRSIEANRVAAVAIPCCVPQRLGAAPDVAYEDYGCLSPQRSVLVWRDARRAS